LITDVIQAKDDLQRHVQELNDLGSELEVDVSTRNMESWASDVREHAKSILFFLLSNRML